jgi:hypothetical protein
MELSTMPMNAGELLEEGHIAGGEFAQRGQFDDRLDLAFEQHRQHDDVARRASNSPSDRDITLEGMSVISTRCASTRTGRSALRRCARGSGSH